MPQLHQAAFKDNGKKKITMDDCGYLGAMWLLHELGKKLCYKWDNIDTQLFEINTFLPHM